MSRVNTSSQRKSSRASTQNPANPEAAVRTKEAHRIKQLVRRIYKAMDRVRSDHERQGGLTRPQSSVIEFLIAQPGRSLKEIAEALELSHGTVSGIVARLEQMELVHRQPDVNDRRIVRHEVTSVVAQYARTATSSHTASPISRALERASPEDRAAILNALSRLEQLMEDD